jgi:hypothetical protein
VNLSGISILDIILCVNDSIRPDNDIVYIGAEELNLGGEECG